MADINVWNDENLIKTLKEGGVVVMPTDTIYGIVGKAESENTVNKIYEIRKRAPTKPCIILIGDKSELQKFSINLSQQQKEILEEYWRDPVSVVLDCPEEKFAYLHRGTNTLAFRLPISKDLRELLLKVGPLVAPSANIEGLESSKKIEDAKKYFGDLVDLYVDGGEITSKPSKVIRLNADGTVAVLRE